MDPIAGTSSFKGTIFHVWKGNQACRIYVADGKVYFIRRVVGMKPGTAAALAGQFGMIGGLAAGLANAAAAKSQSDEFVRDDDPTPPAQLLSKHADNFALSVAEILDPRIEAKGKHVSFGPNDGRWHFMRSGAEKETVVLLESADDAKHAILLLGGLLGSRLRNESGIAGAQPLGEIVTHLPLPPEQAEVFGAMQILTGLIGERVPKAWLYVKGEVRVAQPGSPRALEIVIANGDAPSEAGLPVDNDIYQAATRLARKMSPSVKAFPGLAIEMTRQDGGVWKNNVKLKDR